MAKRRRKKKKDSAAFSFLLILVSILILAGAFFCVYNIIKIIQRDYKTLESGLTKKEEAGEEVLEIEKSVSVGWNETDEGWVYLLDKKEELYAAEQWLAIDGFLYYFDEDGYMATGEFSQDGQIFTCHETKGYLKNIETDLTYVPDSMGEDLDSLARTNAFWVYLDDESDSVFRTILYRKTVENKVMPLGDADNPEKTTRYSLRAEGDYVYYLPKVKDSVYASLTSSEQSLCNTLYRMIPGRDYKELIARNVDGYLILDDVIYFSQNGEIFSTTEGIKIPIGEKDYIITVSENSCYLLDWAGNPVSAENGGSLTIEDRVYTTEEDGKITDISQAVLSVCGTKYSLSGSSVSASVKSQSNGVETTLYRSSYGIQSFCIVGNSIYYCAYVDKSSSNGWTSQIFKGSVYGDSASVVSAEFTGTLSAMYYFEEAGLIFGQYQPLPWSSGYSRIAVIDTAGSVSLLTDENYKNNVQTQGNDVLIPAAIQGDDLICLWQDYSWTLTGGYTVLYASYAATLEMGTETLLAAAIQNKEWISEEVNNGETYLEGVSETVSSDEDQIGEKESENEPQSTQSPYDTEDYVTLIPLETENETVEAMETTAASGIVTPISPLETETTAASSVLITETYETSTVRSPLETAQETQSESVTILPLD